MNTTNYVMDVFGTIVADVPISDVVGVSTHDALLTGQQADRFANACVAADLFDEAVLPNTEVRVVARDYPQPWPIIVIWGCDGVFFFPEGREF